MAKPDFETECDEIYTLVLDYEVDNHKIWSEDVIPKLKAILQRVYDEGREGGFDAGIAAERESNND